MLSGLKWSSKYEYICMSFVGSDNMIVLPFSCTTSPLLPVPTLPVSIHLSFSPSPQFLFRNFIAAYFIFPLPLRLSTHVH